MTSFYDSSVPVDSLELFKLYIVYETSFIECRKDKFFLGELIDLIFLNLEHKDNPTLTFRHAGSKKKYFYTRFYCTVTIKTLQEQHDFVRGGMQSMVSKLYEEKTDQSGKPDAGPAGLICDFLV
jgi:hypothetical protein